MTDSQGGNVDGALGLHHVDAFVIHDVAVLDGPGVVADGTLDGVGVGGVGHDLHTALMANLVCGLQLIREEEAVPVPVPVGAHDAAGEVEFNVIYVVVYLLSDGEHEVFRTVTLLREGPAGSVAAGGGEEIAGCEDARAKVLSRGEGVPPGDVYPVFDSTATDAGDSAFGEALHSVIAIFDDAVGDGLGWGIREHEVHVYVPEAREKPATAGIDDSGAVGVDLRVIGLDAGNQAIFDGDAGVGLGVVGEGINKMAVGDYEAGHGDLLEGRASGAYYRLVSQ